MNDSGKWPPDRKDFERLLRALTYDQIARLFEVSVREVFDLERQYEEEPKPSDEKPSREDDKSE